MCTHTSPVVFCVLRPQKPKNAKVDEPQRLVQKLDFFACQVHSASGARKNDTWHGYEDPLDEAVDLVEIEDKVMLPVIRNIAMILTHARWRICRRSSGC